MKRRELSEVYAYACVQELVERQVARRNSIAVAGLRLLLRVAALTSSGALVRGTDIARTGLTADSHTRAWLLTLRRRDKWLTIRQGGVISGYYQLTPAGKQVCTEFASAQRRAARQIASFEPAQPFNRLEPLK